MWRLSVSLVENVLLSREHMIRTLDWQILRLQHRDCEYNVTSDTESNRKPSSGPLLLSLFELSSSSCVV